MSGCNQHFPVIRPFDTSHLGQANSRFMPDLEAARVGTLSVFLDAFERSLTVGWGGFTGCTSCRGSSTGRPLEPSGHG